MSSKIGFLVSDISDLTFLDPIIRLYEAEDVVIICEDREKPFSLNGDQTKDLLNYKNKVYSNYYIKNISELLATGDRLNLLISIHPYLIGLIEKLSRINIRLSYSIAKIEWQFGEINSHYELVLTQGKYSSAILASKYGVRTKIVSYPRYIEICDKETYDSISTVFNLITIFPTLGSEIVLNYYEEISDLSKEYDIRIRLHPLEGTSTINKYLDKFKKCRIIHESIDLEVKNEDLIRESVLVLHDYGGTCFSSLYFHSNLAFFEQGHELKKNVIDNSPEVLLYYMLQRSISSKNFSDNVRLFIENPLKYDNRIKKIRSIFITDGSMQKLIRIAHKIRLQGSCDSLYGKMRFSKFINSFRSKIGKLKLKYLERTIRKILND
jgi:hypothetical protein